MRRFLLSVIFIFLLSGLRAQKSHKYPSLLWEITGNGLKKPSYLFGTMHVSSKMVFNLSDSFYLAIRRADVVALETNPESWQEDMYNFNFANSGNETSYLPSGYRNTPSDYLTSRTLRIKPYEKMIRVGLVSNPSTIDNLLYRNYSESQSDFEEDTYLDLYIYQIGKKWGKKVLGVERYEESMKLMMEAYVDALKERTRKVKSFEQDDDFSYNKLQDAYRTGNLDLLDTINRVNSFSSAFDEKFLYRRNEIQATSIDSIIKNHYSLFVGVGAAHLPGSRGVIEILRKKGYHLRPIKIGQRESFQKEQIEKIQVPVVFSKQVAADGFFKVDVPGKLYRFSTPVNGFDQQQYADMANGSYYMVTRVQTNAPLWGHSTEAVYRKVDSLLYENIPGRILSRQNITKNGFKGFDIVNKTRRGDLQRYNIYITPFEIIFFKVSGNGEYVKSGKVADRFFNSIELKEYVPQWKKYGPVNGGFQVEMPHEPFVNKDGSWFYAAVDKSTQTAFEVLRTDVHNYEFAEEDTFDLNLMEESFISSNFFDEVISRKQTVHQKYPALEAKYRLKDGSVSLVKYIIQGPHYYTLITRGKTEQPRMQQFLNSFSIKPFVYYSQPIMQSDTALRYTVITPVFKPKKEGIALPSNMEGFYTGFQEADDGPPMERTLYRDGVVANDTTGEKIYISFYKSPRYQNIEDSVNFEKQDRYLNNREASWIIRTKKSDTMPNRMKVWEYTLTDTNSSRMIWTKAFYRHGVGFSIHTETDTLTPPSAFLNTFFKTFAPADTVQVTDPFTKRSVIFFNDFFSTDTTDHKRAVKSVEMMTFDSTDFPQVKKALESLSWKDKNYLAVKKNFIDKLSDIPSRQASDYLYGLYYAAGDTIDLQYAALENLVGQKTKYSYNSFKNIMISDPPVLDINFLGDYESDDFEASFISGLYDSLKLTAAIFPDLLPLVNIDDYKRPMMTLMGTLIDSSLLQAKDYAVYLPKFQLEAKQAWKKQAITEKNKAIEKAQNRGRNLREEDNEDLGNEELNLYAVLLMPFWDKSPAVPLLLRQLLTSSDKTLQYNTALLFVRHDKPVPDSVFKTLASTYEFRYNLYVELNRLGKGRIFPEAWRNNLDLAKSKLLTSAEDERPDTVVFLEKLPVQWMQKSGYVYFFKYKRKKDDTYWKIATVGLGPGDDKTFDWGDEKRSYTARSRYDFTDLSDKKLNNDEPLNLQLQKALKQLIYSKRKSAREFYRGSDDMDAAGMMGLFR